VKKESLNQIEEEFLQQNDQLLDIYETVQRSPSPEEEESNFPILHSLTDPQPRYKELNLIAEGGEKKITRVYDRLLNRNVAMARSIGAKNQKEQEQFLREAHLESNLAHPNIVPVHNIGIDCQGIPFFTMELLPGDNLDAIFDQLKKGDDTYVTLYPLAALLSIFLKICDAIAYAHSRKVLHLDLKPENIKVGQFGEALVCDWGLARILSDETSPLPDTPGELDADLLNHMTNTGIIKGSPGFMAPEQTTPNGRKTEQTDIYALGVILYIILTKNLPVQGQSNQEMVENTRKGNLLSPPRTCPKGLVATAMKALSLKPHDRYASVSALQNEVKRYLSGYPTQAEKASPATHLSLLIQRHSQLTSALLTFLLLTAVGISISLTLINQKRIAAEKATQRAEENFSLLQRQQGISDYLTETLADSSLTMSYSIDYSRPWIMLRNFDKIEIEKLPPDDQVKILQQKAIIYFLLQQFNHAADLFQQIGDTQNLATLSQEFSAKKPDDDKPLSDQQFMDLYPKIYNKRHRLYLYLHHAYNLSGPELELPRALTPFMLAQLNFLPANPAPLKFAQTAYGKHLDLSNTKYATFTLDKIGNPINFLQSLDIDSLDLSNTPFRDPAELYSLRLRELRVTGTPLTQSDSLHSLLIKVGVEKLTIDTQQFSQPFITRLRTHMEVIEE
jgi:serine/threonine protein kinase